MRANLALFRVFVTVVECGSIRPAAARLGRTVSAISMALKQLEDKVGAKLFEGERKIRLTKAGQFTLEQARDLLEYYDRTWATVLAYAHNQVGRIDVASVPSIAATLLPEAIRLTRQASPDLAIEVRDMDSRMVLEAVRKGMVEIGFGTVEGQFPDLSIAPLFSDGLELVCSARDPLARKQRPIEWSDLRGRVFLANATCRNISTPEFRAIFHGAQLQVHNVTSLIALVRAGVGVTVLPRLSKPAGDSATRFLPVADPTARRQVSTIIRKEEAVSPAGLAFLETVRQIVRMQAARLGFHISTPGAVP